eukprot:gene3726-6614_t
MANDLELITGFLQQGSNSLEFDLQFSKNGELVEFTHGFPCDIFLYCNRKTPVKQFMNYFANNEYIKKNCHLAIFDLKIRTVESQYYKKAGGLLAEALNNYFYQNGNQMKAVFSIPTVSRADFLQGFVDSPHSRTIIDKISFGTSVETNARESMERLNVRFKNIPQFYGAGTSAWASWWSPKLELMEGGTKFRDETCSNPNDKRLNKVWYWTADNENLLRKLFKMGVDGICTNFPSIVQMILKNEFQNTHYLANEKNDPFETYCKQ